MHSGDFTLSSGALFTWHSWLVYGLCGLFLTSGCAPRQSQTPNPVLHRQGQIWQPWRTYYRGERYPRLYVEVDRVEGSDPRPESLEELREFLTAHLEKPEGIEIVVDPPIPLERARRSHPRLLALDSIDGPPDSTRTAFLHVLFHDSRAFVDRTSLKAKPHVEFVPYPATVYLDKGFWPSIEKCTEAEFLLHEVGHTLGLVQDLEHGDGVHCEDPDCYMYPTVLYSTFRLLTFRSPTVRRGLCARCQEDIRELRTSDDEGHVRWVGPILLRIEEGYCIASLPAVLLLWIGSPENLDPQLFRDALADNSELIDRNARDRSRLVTLFAADSEHLTQEEIRAALKRAKTDPWKPVRQVAESHEVE